MSEPLVRAVKLKKTFTRPRGPLSFLHPPGAGDAPRTWAVDNVSLEIHEGEALGLVGESGSGKSTVGRLILQLLEADEGTVHFDGEDLGALSPAALRAKRRDMQMVFQDPMSSLNPRMSVGRAIREPMELHGIEGDHDQRVRELMERVGLDPSLATRLPNSFSGGQRQRVGIARALACEPRFVVADEPISSLDVSIQAQILNLFADLKANLTLLFIAHDLATVRHLCDRVAVMHEGKVVEMATTDEVFENPQHPYTRALLAAIPRPPTATQ